MIYTREKFVEDIVTTTYRDMPSTSIEKQELSAIFLHRRSIFVSCRMTQYITQDLMLPLQPRPGEVGNN